MLCQECRRRVDCSALCPQAEGYVNQDVRYQRERPFPKGALESMTKAIALEQWLASQREYRELRGEPIELDMSCLSSRQRQCLELHYFDGLSLGNIGLRLSLSKATVQSYMREGLMKLKTHTIFHLVKGRDDQCAETIGRACQ